MLHIVDYQYLRFKLPFLLLARFDLGDKAPQVNGVKVYNQAGISDEVMLEFDFTWAGQQEVTFVVKPIPVHPKIAAVVLKAVSNLVRVKVSTLLFQLYLDGM